MTTPGSFHNLVGRLAADGGELLRRLTVEHEREVAHLHAEIVDLQAEVARLSGASAAEIQKLRIGAEASGGPKSSPNLPKTGNQRQQERQARRDAQGRSGKHSGKPDENALAKAFDFVDALYDDKGLFPLHAISADAEEKALEEEDNMRVINVATEIAALTRQEDPPDSEGKMQPLALGSALHAGASRTPAASSPRGEREQLPVPRVPAALSPRCEREPLQGVRELRPPADCRELVGVDRDSIEQPGIKLNSISPPVKAPDRLPEPPALPDDDDPQIAGPPLEVLDERLKLSLPSASAGAQYGPAAAATAEASRRPPPPPSRPPDDQIIAGAQSRGDEDDGHGHGGDIPVDSTEKHVPLFIKSVSKPSTEMLLASDSPMEGSPGLDSPSGMPSRETTTWQPSLEVQASIDNSPRTPQDIESPTTPAAEARATSKTGQVPDWRSLLQVQGAKWRPSGDDGVGIAMYLEQPPAVSSKARSPDEVVPPTSI